jgi:hypothetical protein
MKSLILILLTFVTSAQAQSHHDRPSVHGMVIVGTGKVYLSHLPMFHSPHDYQVITEVALSGAGLETYLKSQAQTKGALHTLVPQAFVLPQMMEHPTPFKADIYLGHFERGGEIVASDVTVTIQKVLYFKKFDPTAPTPRLSQLVVFGNSEELFAAHLITAKPDFDQIIHLGASEKVAQAVSEQGASQVELSNVADSEPVKERKTYSAESSELLPSQFSFTVLKSIYLEFGDLCM